MILLTAEQSMERLFDLDWQLIADATGMIIAIFVLFLAMSYFLFEPAKKVLQNRQEKIKNELDEAQSSMEQAQALKEEYEAKLKNIDAEKEAILSEARKNALKNEGEIIARAHISKTLSFRRGFASPCNDIFLIHDKQNLPILAFFVYNRPNNTQEGPICIIKSKKL